MVAMYQQQVRDHSGYILSWTIAYVLCIVITMNELKYFCFCHLLSLNKIYNNAITYQLALATGCVCSNTIATYIHA